MFLKVSNIVSKLSRQQDLNFCLLHFKFLMTPLYHILALGTTDAIKFRLSCDSDETRHIVWGEFRFCHLYCGHSSFVIRQIIYIAVTRHSWFAKSCTWLPIGNIYDEVQAASGYFISLCIRIMVIPCQAHSESWIGCNQCHFPIINISLPTTSTWCYLVRSCHWLLQSCERVWSLCYLLVHAQSYKLEVRCLQICISVRQLMGWNINIYAVSHLSRQFNGSTVPTW